MALAGLKFEERWYYSSYQRSSRFEPHSSVTQLIQGIWEKYPKRAREILRERIYTTEIIPILDPEMVKVSAKRMSLVTRDEWEKLKLTKHEEIIFQIPVRKNIPSQKMTESQAMEFLVSELKLRLEQFSLPLHARDRAVGALLLSSDGEVLSYSLNENAQNRTLHAEILCLQGYWSMHKNAVPEGTALITTLSPCRQCAGMIETVGENLKVVYLEKDPGRLATLS